MDFANHVVSPIQLLGCDLNFKRQTGMWSLYILLAYSEWPVPTAEYHVSEFIPADLNHCHLCRRTHRALIWAELRTVSGMVPKKNWRPCHASFWAHIQIAVWKASWRVRWGWLGEHIHDEVPDEKDWVKVWMYHTALQKQGLWVLCRSFH